MGGSMPDSTTTDIVKQAAPQDVQAAKGYTAAKSKATFERLERERQLAYETAKREAAEVAAASAAKTAKYIKIGLAVVGVGLAAYFLYFRHKAGAAHREDNPSKPRRARTSVIKRGRKKSRREKEEYLHRDVTSMRGARPVHSKVDLSPSRRRKKGRALTPEQRKRIPLKYFVFPERRAWPLHDERHALIAIRYMQMGRGKEIDYPKIIREIKRRFAHSPKVMHALNKFK